jgi:hypothetical protein
MMKLIMIIVDGRWRDEVEEILAEQRATGFTELPMALGEGRSGKRLASRLHPGANTVVFTVVEADRAGPIKEELLKRCDPSAENDEKDSRLRVVIMPVEDFA